MINSLYPIFQHWSERGSVYILSDTHFEDFDCKLMDPNWITPEEQIKIINSMVHKNDTLIHLGDVGNPEWVSKLKAGHKVLIMGNHDKGKNVYLRKKTKTLIEFNTFEEQEEALDKHEIDYVGTEYHKPFIYGVKIQDNHLFDEVYEGCLFISDKILLSHEPVYGLPWCLNIHGHDHNGIEPYKEGCKHINLAANVCGYTPISLGKIIKEGVLSDIHSIHRQTIDRATERNLIRKIEEQFQKLNEKLIEEQDCIFCKHASFNEDKFSIPYCLLMDEYVGSRRGIERDQRCLFWEYCDIWKKDANKSVI